MAKIPPKPHRRLTKKLKEQQSVPPVSVQAAREKRAEERERLEEEKAEAEGREPKPPPVKVPPSPVPLPEETVYVPKRGDEPTPTTPASPGRIVGGEESQPFYGAGPPLPRSPTSSQEADSSEEVARRLRDPLLFSKWLWPEVEFYREQREVIYSVRDNDETFVVAGNMLGKDFVAGFITLWFFLTRHPVRIVTTSAVQHQLEGVLWGEIRRFIQTARYPLDSTRGGPLVVNHLHLRKLVGGQVDGLSYCVGVVARKGEGMLGHHVADVGDGVPRTLFIADEASGVDDQSFERADTWARRKLVIGNPYACTNFFYRGVKGGDVPARR